MIPGTGVRHGPGVRLGAGDGVRHGDGDLLGAGEVQCGELPADLGIPVATVLSIPA